jgi:DNA-binding MarR family transcriptional regulator
MAAYVPELTHHLGYWLRHLSNHVTYAFARKLAGRDVTVSEWALMRVLYDREPVPPSQLADDMGLTRSAISKLADRLIGKALIAREPNHNDGRAHTLRLTKEGTAYVPELARLADQNEADCFAKMPAADRATLERILKEAVVRLGITAIPIE